MCLNCLRWLRSKRRIKLANLIRQKRVGDEIRRVLAKACQDGTLRNLPVLTNCVAVEMNRDLTYARCYMTIPGSDAVKQASLQRLEKLKGFLRHEIMQQISLRQAPDLRFYLDTSLEYGMQIDAKLAELANERLQKSQAAETELKEAEDSQANANEA